MNTLGPTSEPGRSLPTVRWLAVTSLTALTLWLGWKAWDVNITMSCWKDEWPRLAVCEDIMGRTPEEKVAKLRERLARNPSDSEALVMLTIYGNQPGGMPGLDAEALLDAAGKAAPQNRYVLLLQAQRYLKVQAWPKAIDALLRLSQNHREPTATETLANLVKVSASDPKLLAALMAAANANSGWLERVLRAMPKAKFPISSALPLLSQQMDANQLNTPLALFAIGQLKNEGLWMEAHSVWRYLWKRPLDTVFNGDFEQPFVKNGFDWEVSDANDHRSGARIELVSRASKGQVMKVEFTGKTIRPPVLRQDVLLLPGRYVLRGKFQSSELRSEKGLTWVVSCAKDGRELGRTEALKATGREWSKWEAQVNMPTDCEGFGAKLMLQPFAPYEAKTGLRGDVFFDAVRLEKDKGTP